MNGPDLIQSVTTRYSLRATVTHREWMCLTTAGRERVVSVPGEAKQGGEPSHRGHRTFHQSGPGAAAQQRQQAVGQVHEEDRVCTCSCLLRSWQKYSHFVQILPESTYYERFLRYLRIK